MGRWNPKYSQSQLNWPCTTRIEASLQGVNQKPTRTRQANLIRNACLSKKCREIYRSQEHTWQCFRSANGSILMLRHFQMVDYEGMTRWKFRSMYWVAESIETLKRRHLRLTISLLSTIYSSCFSQPEARLQLWQIYKLRSSQVD